MRGWPGGAIELSAWIFSPTLTRHSHLMSTQRGNFHLPGDLRTAGGTPHFFGAQPFDESSPWIFVRR